MIKQLVFFSLLIAAALSAQTLGPACSTTDSGQTVPNYGACANLASPDQAKVYCYATNRDEINGYNGRAPSNNLDYHCVQCMSDCDCGNSQYCQLNSRIENAYGLCQDIPSGKIGSRCSPDAHADINSDSDNYPYVNNLWCGVMGSYKRTNDPDNETNYSVLWEGKCVNHKCRACDSSAIDSACVDCYASTCAGDKYSTNGNNVGSDGLKGQRWCVDNAFTYSSAPALSSFVSTLFALF
eukprot:TRINITY_DN2227_c0_g1_i1.p1 TRINITY_DN2227_c0_g1~~TRINITY_DN2227_c0_g1_i1.p1  ORF type:complete len:239 (-),score=40.82 TRINITY_DN2227_c0_g1_i1:46-762(-)